MLASRDAFRESFFAYYHLPVRRYVYEHASHVTTQPDCWIVNGDGIAWFGASREGGLGLTFVGRESMMT